MACFLTSAEFSKPSANIIALCAALILIPFVVTAQSISITDFRIPESSYQRLTGTLNGNWATSSQDYGSLYPSTSMNTYTNISNGFSYVLGTFSEERSLQINAALNSSYSSRDSKSDEPTAPFHTDQASLSASVRPNVNVLYAPYFIPDAWFWAGQVQATGTYSYSHTSSSEQIPNLDSSWASFLRTRNYQYAVSAGIGYGKVRDGQPIFAALRVLDKLEEDSALVRPLSRDEILTLADVLARRSEYSILQDRYYKFITEDVFKKLEAMGVIKGGLASAFDVMKAVEVLQYERIEPRLFGWRASASIVRSAMQNQYNESEGGSFTRYAMEYLQLASDYGYPVSLNTQLYAYATLQFPREDSKRRIGATLGGTATYQMTDRIDARLGYILTRSSSPILGDDQSENFQRQLSHQVTLGFIFFIENDVMFNVNTSYQHQRLDIFIGNAIGSPNTYSTYSASFGITYRFF